MTEVNEQDIEQLELYLDRELSPDEVTELDARLATEPSLRSQLDRLRGQRGRRLAAMSTAFDTDAATIERLVASVRTAQVSETIQRRRLSMGWLRPALSAAACVAFGLLLGITLHRQHSGSTSGISASPITEMTGGQAGLFDSVGFSPQKAYVVSVREADGRERMRVRFPNRQAAEQFMQQVNANGAPTVDLGGARILEQPY